MYSKGSQPSIHTFFPKPPLHAGCYTILWAGSYLPVKPQLYLCATNSFWFFVCFNRTLFSCEWRTHSCQESRDSMYMIYTQPIRIFLIFSAGQAMGIWPMSNCQKVSSGISLTLETVYFLFYLGFLVIIKLYVWNIEVLWHSEFSLRVKTNRGENGTWERRKTVAIGWWHYLSPRSSWAWSLHFLWNFLWNFLLQWANDFTQFLC